VRRAKPVQEVKENEKNVMEVVIDQESQMLPRYVVYFKQPINQKRGGEKFPKEEVYSGTRFDAN